MDEATTFVTYAYILAGWGSLKNFIGSSFILVAQEIGERLYRYLDEVGLVEECDCSNIDNL